MDHDELISCGLYHHARALVTASVTENQPVTVLEALGCNTPVIIPDVKGINELLEDNGLFFEAGNIDDFAGQMLRIANDDELYKRCRVGSRSLRAEFDGFKIARKFEEVYRSC